MSVRLYNDEGQGMTWEMVSPEVLRVPYGEYPHKRGLQVLDNEAAEAMQAGFRGVAGRLRGMFRGVPIYIGHPDVPELSGQWPDKRAYGWVKDVLAANDALEIHVQWGRAGRELVEDAAFRFFSPYWGGQEIGGRRVRPMQLWSVGLTNTPNIPVPALSNDEGTDQTMEENEMELSKLVEMLGLAPEATAEDVEAALVARLDRLAELEAAEAAANAEEEEEEEGSDGDGEAAEGEVADVADVAAEGEGEDEPAEDEELEELENSVRATRAASAVDGLILSGRVTPAQREELTGRLAGLDNSAMSVEVDRLASGGQVLKTQGVTGGLGGEVKKVMLANDAQARKTERLAVVAELMEGGLSHDQAWTKARRVRPELF